jgi:hypothetical protein
MLKLAYCGDDCNLCPRYIATQSGSEEQLKKIAVLWKTLGWRETVLPPEEMVCHGCTSVKLKLCKYSIIRECAQDKGLENCGKCRNYPCSEIEKVFEQSKIYAKSLKEKYPKDVCELVERAFFLKKQKLDSAHTEYLSGQERAK